MPSRLRLVPRRFSQASAARTCSSNGRALRGRRRRMAVLPAPCLRRSQSIVIDRNPLRSSGERGSGTRRARLCRIERRRPMALCSGGRRMPTLEERVAYLEGQVSEHSHALVEVRDAIRHLEQRMDARFEGVDRRLDTVDRRIDALDEKVSRQFVWLVGIQVTTLVANRRCSSRPVLTSADRVATSRPPRTPAARCPACRRRSDSRSSRTPCRRRSTGRGRRSIRRGRARRSRSRRRRMVSKSHTILPSVVE